MRKMIFVAESNGKNMATERLKVCWTLNNGTQYGGRTCLNYQFFLGTKVQLASSITDLSPPNVVHCRHHILFQKTNRDRLNDFVMFLFNQVVPIFPQYYLFCLGSTEPGKIAQPAVLTGLAGSTSVSSIQLHFSIWPVLTVFQTGAMPSSRSNQPIQSSFLNIAYFTLGSELFTGYFT